jgi:hypothetical protein
MLTVVIDPVIVTVPLEEFRKILLVVLFPELLVKLPLIINCPLEELLTAGVALPVPADMLEVIAKD